jgi:hypothetical protein
MNADKISQPPNTNGRGIKGETAIRSMNLLAGEVAGSAVEVAVLSHIENFDAALPGPTSAIKTGLKNYLIKPLLKPIESVLNYTKGIEGQEDFNKRMAQPEDVRAQKYADAVYRYSIATGVGYTTMLGAQSGLNKVMGVPMRKEDSFTILKADAAVHIGAIALMSMPGISETTQRARNALSCVFKSFGVEEEKAKDMANYAIVVQVPNYAAFLADVGVLYALSKGRAKST